MQDTFPELAKGIAADLRKLRRFDLVEQVPQLHIVDRCRCGLEACGTFYTEFPDSRKRKVGNGIDVSLSSGVTLTEAAGTIVRVETLDPRIETALRGLIP